MANETTRISMNIHGASGVTLLAHRQREGTEWAEIKIGHVRIVVFDREAIDDALHLPRDADFSTNFAVEEAA